MVYSHSDHLSAAGQRKFVGRSTTVPRNQPMYVTYTIHYIHMIQVAAEAAQTSSEEVYEFHTSIIYYIFYNKIM